MCSFKMHQTRTLKPKYSTTDTTGESSIFKLHDFNLPNQGRSAIGMVFWNENSLKTVGENYFQSELVQCPTWSNFWLFALSQMDVSIVSSAGLGLNELLSTKNTCRLSVFQLYVIVFGLQVADFCKEKFRTIVVEWCVFSLNQL